MKTLCAMIVLALNGGSAVWAGTEHLSITLNADNYEIVDAEDGLQTIRMDGFGSLLVPGKPMLPVKVFMIALPPGAQVVSVTVTDAAATELPGSHRIRPAPPPMPANDSRWFIERNIEEWQDNYARTYSSDAAYPEWICRYLGTGGLRKYTFTRVAFFPFTYQPISGRLLFHPWCDITISYSCPYVQSEELQELLFDTVADSRASQLLVNWSEADQWYTPTGSEQAKETYDYIIITTQYLQDAVSPLVAWKKHIGYSPKIVTTSWISENYSGRDLQEQIRNFLIDKYAEWGIEYVLLAGNIDIIPMRYCFPHYLDHDPHSEMCTPTDYYYADLTGDWDSDGDGFHGEYGQDDVDFVPEIYVGRIPWNTEVSSTCRKIVQFEQDIGDWKNRALLLGAMSNYENEDYSGIPRTDGAELMEEMIGDMLSGWSYTTMYEKEGLEPCPLLCDFPLTNANVVGNWSTNAYGIVNWWAHGTTTTAWRLWWAWDDGDAVPEYAELQWASFLGNADVPVLNDDYPAIIFSCSCDNGQPEVNNLARELMRRGSASIVAATRVSFYSPGWEDESYGGNGSIDYYFFHYLVNENEKVGEALYDSKVYYFNHLPWWDCFEQQNMFTFCLYGDPALMREIFFPLLSVYNYEWTDSGGDGHVDPGDTVNLVISLLNSGQTASVVEAELHSSDSFITLADSSSSYGGILSDSVEDNRDDPFVLLVNQDAPLHICTLDVTITTDSMDFSDTLFLTIGIPPVLVIDGDGGDSYETHFCKSLERIGVLFDMMDLDDAITGSFVSDYHAVVWLTGNSSSPIDSASVLILSDYLDAGGNLFSSGQDVERCVDTSFYRDYLHAILVEDSVRPIRVEGVEGDPVGDGLSFLIMGTPGANNQVTPSMISPIAGADSILNHRTGGCCGVRYGGSYRTVYLSFGFEAVNPLPAADTLMARILRWFGLSVGIEEELTCQEHRGVRCSLNVLPNPFRGELQITYSVAIPSVVQLRIYDTAGRHIRGLLRELTNPGIYRFRWDGRDSGGSRLPSGVYFCRMEAGDFSSTKKLIVLR